MSAAKIIPNKPFIVYLYGYPGAGKTAFARQLAEEMNLAHIQQDKLLSDIYGSNEDPNPKTTRNVMSYMCKEFLKAGVSVVHDTDLTRAADRKRIREEAKRAKAIPVLVWLQIDPETAYNRGLKRDRRKSDDHYAKSYTTDTFKQAMEKMQNPDNEDYVVISGKHTFQTQRAAVFKRFYDLGILNPAQFSKNTVKPGLVNLIPQSPSTTRDGITKRSVKIR